MRAAAGPAAPARPTARVAHDRRATTGRPRRPRAGRPAPTTGRGGPSPRRPDRRSGPGREVRDGRDARTGATATPQDSTHVDEPRAVARRRPSGSTSRAPRRAPGPRCGPATGSARSTCSACPRRSWRPTDGLVGASLVEAGRAVEYGQELVVIEFALGRGVDRPSEPGGPLTRVPQDPDRQPRRDRPPDPARLPRPRRGGGRRVQRGGPRVARRPARGRGDLHRPGRRQAVVPVGVGGDLCRAHHRLRCDPPGLRLPVRGRGVRRGRGRPRPDVHRSAGRGPRTVRQQGRDPRSSWPPTASRRSRARTACCATRCTPSARRSGSAIRC